MYEYKASIFNVVDGDTIKVLVDLGFMIYVHKTLRLARINAPEVSTQEGIVSKQYLIDKLPIDTKIVFKSCSLDRYGRSIAEVTVIDKNLSDMIVADGHAIYQKY